MKKKTLTNRKLAEKLNIPIGKVRRNTKEFLGADPIATKRSGYQREFSLNDGFFVALGTTLVSHHGLSFANARKAIDTIKPWLLKIGYVPDPPPNAKLRGIEKEITRFNITFHIYEGELLEIFSVDGVIPRDEHPTKEDSFGLRYVEEGDTRVYYYIKSESGKISYFIPWEVGVDFLPRKYELPEDYHEDGVKTDDFLFNCDRINDVDLTGVINNFLAKILDSKEANKLIKRWFY